MSFISTQSLLLKRKVYPQISIVFVIRPISLNIQELKDTKERYPFTTQIINGLNRDTATFKENVCVYEVGFSSGKSLEIQ